MRDCAVLITGPTAVGKATLIKRVTMAACANSVLRDLRVAPRATTRALHDREKLSGQSIFMDGEAFYRATQAGSLDVHWRRKVSDINSERYGFSVTREFETGGVLILSANNYLDWTQQPVLQALRSEGRLMVVRIHASPDIRLARLRTWRPPLSDWEIASRMADLPADLLPPADHVVPNDPGFEAAAEWQLLQLITSFSFSMGNQDRQVA